MSAETRAAATALMYLGNYREHPDSADWLMVDAQTVAAAVPDGPEAVLAALEDLAWMDPTWPDSVERAHEVARRLCGFPVEGTQP
jgi:hypothetical protein